MTRHALLAPLALLLVCAFAPPASAQTSSHVVVLSETPLRCDARARAYAVATLAPGTVLPRDASPNAAAEGWLRVAYPSGASALVPDESVERQGERVRVLDVSKLRALNAAAGPNGSWKRLTLADDQIPALNVLETVDARGGRTWHRVEAPASARAFVLASATRPATAEEVRAAGLNATSSPTPETGDDDSQISESISGGAEIGTLQPGADRTQPSAPQEVPGDADPEAGTLDLTESMQAADGTPIDLQDDLQATNQARPQPVTPETPSTSLVALERAFTRLTQNPDVDAEYDDLLASFVAAREGVRDGSDADRLRQRIDQRVAALELMRDWRDRVRTMEARRTALDAERQRALGDATRAMNSGVYSMVGRLTSSAVFDGAGIARLYRLVSVDDGPVRTLGYLDPAQTPGLDASLGRLVGVLGTVRVDGTRGVRLIEAQRVDAIQSR